MPKHSITIRKLTVSVSAIKSLSPEQRYTYYLFGHVLNEMILLGKSIRFAMPKHNDIRNARLDPELAQALFFLRIASSKVLEAQNCLRQKRVQEVLQKTIFSLLPTGYAMQEKIQSKIKNVPWLSPIRNKLSFHYPLYNDWLHVTTPTETWEDDIVFIGDLDLNIFFNGSEAVCQHWMFGNLDVDPTKAVRPMIEAMLDLLTMMCKFLDAVLNVYLTELLLDGPMEPETVGKIYAEDINTFSMPFWVHNPRACLANKP